jgi:hypothetical protein
MKQSWFFEKINKIDKPLANLTKRKILNPKKNKIRGKKGKITTDITDTQQTLGE